MKWKILYSKYWDKIVKTKNKDLQYLFRISELSEKINKRYKTSKRNTSQI